MASGIVASTTGSSIAMRMRGRDQRFLYRQPIRCARPASEKEIRQANLSRLFQACERNFLHALRILEVRSSVGSKMLKRYVLSLVCERHAGQSGACRLAAVEYFRSHGVVPGCVP